MELEVKRRYRTQGIKGQKLPRINMAFEPDIYRFVHQKADQERVSMTYLVNGILRSRMEEEGWEEK